MGLVAVVTKDGEEQKYVQRSLEREMGFMRELTFYTPLALNVPWRIIFFRHAALNVFTIWRMKGLRIGGLEEIAGK